MMRRRTRPLTAIAVLAAAVALAACGGDDDENGGGDGAGTGTETTATTAGEPVATVELTESDFKIEPEDAEVAEAGLIRFSIKNTGQTEHALEVEGPGGESETEPFGPGETATLDVELERGTYRMYCPVGDHEDRGMEGTVVVAGGDGDGRDDRDGRDGDGPGDDRDGQDDDPGGPDGNDGPGDDDSGGGSGY